MVTKHTTHRCTQECRLRTEKLTDEKTPKARAAGPFIHNEHSDESSARREQPTGAISAGAAITTSVDLLSTPILLKTAEISNSKFLLVSSNPETKERTNLSNCQCTTAPLAPKFFNWRSNKSNFVHFVVWISHFTKPRRHLSTRPRKPKFVCCSNCRTIDCVASTVACDKPNYSSIAANWDRKRLQSASNSFLHFNFKDLAASQSANFYIKPTNSSACN